MWRWSKSQLTCQHVMKNGVSNLAVHKETSRWKWRSAQLFTLPGSQVILNQDRQT